MKNCKFCWAVTGVSVILMVGMAYVFLVQGAVEEGEDGRTAVLLSPAEHNKVLGEMRGLLEAVQTITVALVDEDMESVTATAHSVGMAAARAESPAMLAKLPLDFKALGMSMHKAFDDLGQEAADMGDGKEIQRKLGALLEKCTSCHAGYQLKIETE